MTAPTDRVGWSTVLLETSCETPSVPYTEQLPSAVFAVQRRPSNGLVDADIQAINPASAGTCDS